MLRVFKGNPLADLIVKDAKDLADSLSKSASDETTKSQIRRFYQEYVSIRAGIQGNNESDYKKNEVAIKMMIPKVDYAVGRKGSKLSPDFADWLKENIQAIKSAQDVHDFGDYFEAFVGYFYGNQKQQDEKQKSSSKNH